MYKDKEKQKEYMKKKMQARRKGITKGITEQGITSQGITEDKGKTQGYTRADYIPVKYDAGRL